MVRSACFASLDALAAELSINTSAKSPYNDQILGTSGT
jgi:hypothetical protein